jgi:hypothetical protein
MATPTTASSVRITAFNFVVCLADFISVTFYLRQRVKHKGSFKHIRSSNYRRHSNMPISSHIRIRKRLYVICFKRLTDQVLFKDIGDAGVKGGRSVKPECLTHMSRIGLSHQCCIETKTANV